MPKDLKISEVSFLSPGFFSVGFGCRTGLVSGFGGALVLEVGFSGPFAGFVSAFVGSALIDLFLGGSATTAGGGGGRTPVRR